MQTPGTAPPEAAPAHSMKRLTLTSHIRREGSWFIPLQDRPMQWRLVQVHDRLRHMRSVLPAQALQQEVKEATPAGRG